MKATKYTDQTGQQWDTFTLSINDEKISKPPKFEHHTQSELDENRKAKKLYACFDTSYNQFMTAHCVLIYDYNLFIDIYAAESTA